MESQFVSNFVGDYFFLSNAYNSNIHMTIDGRRMSFLNLECAYQAHKKKKKAADFQFLSAYDAAKYGRAVPLRKDWDNIRDSVIDACIEAKFGKNTYFRNMLAKTKGPIRNLSSTSGKFGAFDEWSDVLLCKKLEQKRDEILKERDTPYVRDKGSERVLFPDEYVVIDLETTGYDARHDGIIELSALKCSKGTVIDTFDTFVYPERAIPKDIVSLTGITDEMVKDAPNISEVIDTFSWFVGNKPVVGYSTRFDVDFVYDNLKRCSNVDFKNEYIDVMKIAMKHYGSKKMKLVNLADKLGIDSQGAHRSINDCYMCNECYKSLQTEITKNMSLDAFVARYDPLSQPKQLSMFDNIDPKKSVSASVKNETVLISNENSKFNGKSFKGSFGSHKFSDEEIADLIVGKEITIKDFVTKKGKVIDIKGCLGEGRLPNGKVYFGFQRTDINRAVPFVSTSSPDLSNTPSF